MADDLIPPPSPAGRPEGDWERAKGTFSESTLLQTDAEHALTQPEPEIVPTGPSRYRSRFGFVLGALVGIGVAAVVVAVLIASGDSQVRQPPWSAWKPTHLNDPDIAAVEIAQHVAHEYRLNSGDQLVDVAAQSLNLDGTSLQVVIRSAGKGEGGDIIDVPGKSMLFVLHGLGPRGSIDQEQPSTKRLRLVQREAYELALYAFKYVKGIDNVVTFIPPAPPTATSASGGSATPSPSATPAATMPAQLSSGLQTAQDQPLPAMLFLPGDVEASLKRPLADTFPDAAPPRPATMSNTEAAAFEAFAQVHSFNASVVTDQTGAGYLVLDRTPTSVSAQDALRSTLKA